MLKVDRILGAILLCFFVFAMGSCGGGGDSQPSPPASDTQAPTQPTGLIATAISSSQINLSWSASSDNIGVAGYKVYRSGTYLKAVTTTSTSDTGLSASTQYCYTISAYDSAGNESGKSSSACATTPVASGASLNWPHAGHDTRNSRYVATASASQSLTGWTSASATLPSEPRRQLLIGDVNGDNVNDIVISISGKVLIYSGSGTLQKTITVPTSDSVATLIDINSDGVLDIGMNGGGGTGKAYFLSGSTGSELWSYTRTVGYDATLGPVYMINGKLLVGGYTGYSLTPRGYFLVTPSGSTGAEQWYYEMGPCTWGEAVSATDTYVGFPYYTCHNGKSGSGVNNTGTTTTDGEGWYYLLKYDGKEQFVKKVNNTHTNGGGGTFILFNGKILGTETHDSTYYPGTNKVRLFDTSGNELVVKTGSQNEDWNTPAFDATRIVIGGRYSGKLDIYSPDDLSVLASTTLSNFYWVVAIHDLNGDGTAEIIVLTGTKVSVLSTSLSELASYSFATTADSARGAAVADVTGDAKADIVVVTKDKLVIFQSGSAKTLLSEDFEDNVLSSEMTVSKTGTFNSAPGIKSVTDLGSTKAFGFGRSSCGASCFESYVTKLTITFPSATYVSTISFKTMELYGNWGSYGDLYVDGAKFTTDTTGFDKLPRNDFTADTIPRTINYTIGKTVTNLEFKVGDITSSSEIFIDDLVIYGN